MQPKFHLVTIIFKQDNVLKKHLISWHDPSCNHLANFRAVYQTSLIFYVLNFFISFSPCFALSNNCQMFKCQITFSKLFLSMSNKFFTGSDLNAINFYGTLLFCYTILCLKFDVPWGHCEKKTLLPMVSSSFSWFFANYC